MTVTAPSPIATNRRLWLKALVGGLLLWALTVAVLWATQVTTLAPVVIFVGSFLSPVVFAVWVFEREEYTGVTPDGKSTALSIPLLVAAFGVAVIEETIKIAIVWWLARSLKAYYLRDGMVLGACVGFGFAAFETSGYAFNALIQADDTKILPVVETQLVRGLLTPVGHGLWTALLAGALFAAASKTGKLHISWSVVGWWFVVVVLHWVWDASTGLAVVFTLLSTGNPVTLTGFETGKLVDPTQGEVHLLAIYSWVLLTTCALVGIYLANRMWVKGRAIVAGFPYGPEVGEPSEAKP